MYVIKYVAIQKPINNEPASPTKSFLPHLCALSFFSKKHLNLTDILCGLKAYRLNKYRNYKSSNPDIIGTNYLFYGINNGVRISEIKINSNSLLYNLR